MNAETAHYLEVMAGTLAKMRTALEQARPALDRRGSRRALKVMDHQLRFSGDLLRIVRTSEAMAAGATLAEAIAIPPPRARGALRIVGGTDAVGAA